MVVNSAAPLRFILFKLAVGQRQIAILVINPAADYKTVHSGNSQIAHRDGREAGPTDMKNSHGGIIAGDSDPGARPGYGQIFSVDFKRTQQGDGVEGVDIVEIIGKFDHIARDSIADRLAQGA